MASTPIFFTAALPLELSFTPSPEIIHHLRVRRRLQNDFTFILSTGTEFTRCSLKINKKNVTAQREQDTLPTPPLTKSFHLYQAILKPESMAWAIQKATELGVVSITPLKTERVQAHYWNEKKKDHYQSIIESAATQSGRYTLPCLNDPKSISQIPWDSLNTWILANFDGASWSCLDDNVSCGVLIGPEGGFTQDECHQMSPYAKTVRLGDTILRAETAAIACLSLLCCQ